MADVPDVRGRAETIANDRDSGASELVVRLLPLLQDALAESRAATLDVVRTVCRGQPAMAPLWHASAAALAEAHQPGIFARVRAEMERAPRALARAAADALHHLLTPEAAPTILTLSYSGSVATTLRQVHTRQPLQVICGEGRPRFEGRRLAQELAASGLRVTSVVDAALTTYLSGASAIVLGADAVLANHWINKVGTFGLCAAASFTGTPVFVIASRDKFVPAALTQRLDVVSGPPVEVWPGPDERVMVANPYFETVPVELATTFLTDVGALPPSQTVEVGFRGSEGRIRQLLNELQDERI